MLGIVLAALIVLPSATPSAVPSTEPRRANSVVMDLDLEEYASMSSDPDIVGTIQLILDRIAAQTAPLNRFRQPRSIVWLPVNANKECQSQADAGILEITYAHFTTYNKQWVLIGRQSDEAQLAFQILDCSGRVILQFPDNGAIFARARFSPYYLSIAGTAAAIAVSTAHANNLSIAATISIINGYGPLQANIGEHDPGAAAELALFRLMGNIPGKDVPPPAPGTVANTLGRCHFYPRATDGSIALRCS
jgi:hypothetical protein